MDHAPIDQVADLRSPPPVGAPPELAIDDLARLFGIADLADRLTAVDQRIADTLGRDGTVLAPAAARVASTGGKRLRPLLTIVAAAVGDVFDDRVISAAAAVELVQVGSLVHDDILDRALTRRGQPTINAVEGLNHAVLAGDYILARAAELAASVSREAAALLADALGDLCEGQALELRDAFDPDRSIDDHVASIRGKTAALFACASRLGAHCGGVSPRNATALGHFGEEFGMSFQVLDDMLDLIGDADRLGKPTGIDIESGVYTLPVLTALRETDGDGLRRLLAGRLGGGEGAHAAAASPAAAAAEHRSDVARAIDLVRASGSIAVALAAVDRYADNARRAVAHLNQTRIGEGLAAFPRTYVTWALESFMDSRYLEVPLTVLG
jgi:geranylgeranyl pyrophosphate synthase